MAHERLSLLFVVEVEKVLLMHKNYQNVHSICYPNLPNRSNDGVRQGVVGMGGIISHEVRPGSDSSTSLRVWLTGDDNDRVSHVLNTTSVALPSTFQFREKLRETCRDIRLAIQQTANPSINAFQEWWRRVQRFPRNQAVVFLRFQKGHPPEIQEQVRL